MNGKFFIFGSKRGGTTLLRTILNNHSSINVPNESHFLIPILKKYNWNKDALICSNEEKSAFLDLIINHGRFNTWKSDLTDLTDISNTFPNGFRPVEFIDKLFEKEVGDKVLFWGDKTPEYSDYVNELRQWFPDAFHIIIIRDGRDVSNSLKNRGWEGWTILQRASYWRRIARKLNESIDDKTVLIRYEDLVCSLEESLRKCLSLLSLDYEEQMQSFDSKESVIITELERSRGIHDSLFKEPTLSDTNKWKKNKSLNVFLFECIAWRELKIFNYELGFFNPKSIFHQSARLVYIFYASVLQIIFFLYHRFFKQKYKTILNNYDWFKALKKLFLKG